METVRKCPDKVFRQQLANRLQRTAPLEWCCPTSVSLTVVFLLGLSSVAPILFLSATQSCVTTGAHATDTEIKQVYH